MTMYYAACVEYDGSRFSGWQAQKHQVRTVQSVVEHGLSKVANEPIKIITAGRTDAGVHATHQVIHFETTSSRSDFSWCRGTNRFMDHDVRLHWVTPVDSSFHARFAALSRTYRFVIYNNSIQSALFRDHSTFEYRTLDSSQMARAAKALIGEHDFSSFRAAGCQAHSPIRTITHFNLYQQNEWIWFDIQANAFLQHMVRNIAGALIEIGCGQRDIHWLSELLDLKDRTKGAFTAAPNGLYLVGVAYPDQFHLPTKQKLPSFWGRDDIASSDAKTVTG